MTSIPTNRQTVPLAVWPSEQSECRVDASADTSGEISPNLVRRIVEEYSRPGALVIGPITDTAQDLDATIGGHVDSLDLIVISPSPACDAAVFRQCFEALRPGGMLVTVTRNPRVNRRLVNLAGLMVSLAHQGGFVYLQHVVSLLSEVRDSELVAQPSDSEIRQIRVARDRGYPIHLSAHQDVLVFSKGAARV